MARASIENHLRFDPAILRLDRHHIFLCVPGMREAARGGSIHVYLPGVIADFKMLGIPTG